ncbi:MAG: uL15 family ribosomal protein [Candidatus Vogelbacteria bacterium]|nr:uL15 family ribosomal protein [Candidatus Vogelbacteria bacterium]
MQIGQLKRNTARKKSRRVGRGGKRGTFSGRGTKGQKARAGRKLRPELRDIIKKIPKLRGYRFTSIEVKPFICSIASLDASFASGDAVNPATLVARGLVRCHGGRVPRVKILGQGDLSKKLTVSGVLVSASARTKIESAGGTIAQ